MAMVVRKGSKLLRPVALIGFMGAGKSLVGRSLAEALGQRFEDLDERVAAEQKQSVTELFAAGESAFRAAEMAALRHLVRERPGIWALGGGTPCTAEARTILAEAGCLVVWLAADWPVLEARVSGEGRPLWANGPDAVRRLWTARVGAYRAAADWVVDAAPPPATVARGLADRLREEGYVG